MVVGRIIMAGTSIIEICGRGGWGGSVLAGRLISSFLKN